MKIFTTILRTLILASAFLCFNSVVSAKDYTTTLADNVTITYAVNTTDLIARIKRVNVFTGTPPKRIEIPKTIKYKSGSNTYTLTVTKIGDGAFDDVEIKTIVLPNTITYIGNDAFNFSYVENLNIPDKVESIGDRAFYCCSIKSAVIPGTCKSIGADAFKNSEIEYITFNESITPLSIGKNAFESAQLHNVTLPFRLSSLGEGAFANNWWLQTAKIMSSKITVIPNKCFYYCKVLQSIELPSSIISIGDMAFQDCWFLNSFSSLLPNLKTIGNFAFCSSGLSQINLPEGLISIGNHAFEDNTNLKMITFPSTLQKIGDNCFAECYAIKSVTCDAVTPPTAGVNCFSADCSKIPAYVPEKSVSAYEHAYCWSAFDYGHYHNTGIGSVDIISPQNISWFDMQGRPLNAAPSVPGIYIRVANGKSTKVIIR